MNDTWRYINGVKITEGDVTKIFAMASLVYTQKDIGEHFGINPAIVGEILKTED